MTLSEQATVQAWGPRTTKTGGPPRLTFPPMGRGGVGGPLLPTWPHGLSILSSRADSRPVARVLFAVARRIWMRRSADEMLEPRKVPDTSSGGWHGGCSLSLREDVQ